MSSPFQARYLAADLSGENLDENEVDRHAREVLAKTREDPQRSRIAACVLGAAIGDAIGHPTEFIESFDAIYEKYGPTGVTGYTLYWKQGDRKFAPYTDDTQMAELVLRSLLWSRSASANLDATMTDLVPRFVDWSQNPQGGHRAPGRACMTGCRALAHGAHWSTAGGAVAGGCGSVMRVYPVGLAWKDNLDVAEAWAVAQSKLTHRDPIALAACAAMARGVALAVNLHSPEAILQDMVDAARRHSEKTADMMAQAVDEATSGVPPTVTLQRLQGWAAHEAIAATVYIFARHPDDLPAAILEGANTPGDSDSLATLAGALVGARTGLSRLPDPWIEELERWQNFVLLADWLA